MHHRKDKTTGLDKMWTKSVSLSRLLPVSQENPEIRRNPKKSQAAIPFHFDNYVKKYDIYEYIKIGGSYIFPENRKLSKT